ncbi:uncharacterized protein IUM83_12830 [Phytophthora cinnamomi]|uniref:uncharacterized protein n=1 Tax=Phytophthora cinnamomi TaxID=4785 RepID=UPI00355A6F7E|nr:hypothetical protein IUM83_12830 [Phytophthora cinnamomi]
MSANEASKPCRRGLKNTRIWNICTFDNSLLELPEDMLDCMTSLTFIHLGMHIHLQKLPSFKNLKSLKALTLALFVELVELPAFESLSNLERLVLSYVPSIMTIPDLTALQKLKTFAGLVLQWIHL